MKVHAEALVIGGALCLSRLHVQANLPRSGTDIRTVTVSADPPYPSEEEVLRGLPNNQVPRKNVRVLYQILVHREGPVRFYPLVGRAQLVETHFKCTVFSDQGREVVYIDVNQFRQPK